MQIDEYVQLSERTCAKLNPLFNDFHMILGMITEVGELADAYKKYIAYKKPLDFINVQEEIGDLMWYIVNFCRINNFNLEEILANNIEKLQSRYPEKFDQEHAINRDLEKEREILNKLK